MVFTDLFDHILKNSGVGYVIGADRTEDPPPTRGMDRLCKHKQNSQSFVAVEPGSIQESFALTNPGLRLKPFAKALDMVFDLKFGRSNAALIDPDILPRFLKRFPKLTVCQLPLPKAQRSDGLGIVMKKSISAKKVRALQQAISFLKKQGVMKKLAKKWDVCRDRR